jgi:diaminopimelate decarboxylase
VEIKEALTLARASVEEADLPEPWQGRAFGEVLRHLLGGNAPAPAQAAARTEPIEATSPGASSGLARLAVRFGVSAAGLADVLDVEDDGVMLHVASAKISATKSKATREVALLIVAARQGAGIDESWTDVGHIRDALQSYNRYDASNFSKYLRDTEDVFNFRGKPVQLRLTRPGWEAAIELVRTLTGSGQ